MTGKKQKNRIKVKASKWVWNFTWIFFRPALNHFCYLKISGKENLAKVSNPFIAAIAVHANYADAYIVGGAFPFNSSVFPIRYMIKARVFDTWAKLIYKTYGAFKVEYGIGVENALKDSIDFIKNGEVVGIFVEGKISKDGRMQMVKPGVAHLALQTGAPILPVILSGTLGLHWTNFLLRRKKISVSFCSPIILDQLALPDNGRAVTDANVQFITKIIEMSLQNKINQ